MIAKKNKKIEVIYVFNNFVKFKKKIYYETNIVNQDFFITFFIKIIFTNLAIDSCVIMIMIVYIKFYTI